MGLLLLLQRWWTGIRPCEAAPPATPQPRAAGAAQRAQRSVRPPPPPVLSTHSSSSGSVRFLSMMRPWLSRSPGLRRHVQAGGGGAGSSLLLGGATPPNQHSICVEALLRGWRGRVPRQPWLLLLLLVVHLEPGGGRGEGRRAGAVCSAAAVPRSRGAHLADQWGADVDGCAPAPEPGASTSAACAAWHFQTVGACGQGDQRS